ncbi:uncharacterized protein YbbC (DUF1343 family)/CubicO group peptidase (beta-lactamase class C family) [Ereboglobus sp. PH5-5]|nr:uncharacterized protein YbbC (DUF1343 family)/CubicO group peptidase (beta-lactamase class C family) [Ereboglobus sp. PH5-5]
MTKHSAQILMNLKHTLVFLFCSLCLCLCASSQAAPRTPALRPEKLAEMQAFINDAIAQGHCPGAVLWVEHNGERFHSAFGKRALVPAEETMTEDTIFDLASLTKVVACTPSVMLLLERGQIKLDEPVRTYIPEFAGEGKERITVRQLMTHTSGLRSGIETKSDWSGAAAAIEKACAEIPRTPPGAAFRYSDINFFMLGEIVRRVSGTPLSEFAAREIFAPLKMADTGYLPAPEKLPRIAPTEVVQDKKPWRGVVHDPTARKMGGVAGHAGLFSTAADLARYARMLLNEGELDGARIFKPETVRLMTSVQTSGDLPPRALGWDIASGYSRPRGKIFPFGSFGHTGFTGTILWIDPHSRTFYIFLSSRTHPTRKGNIVPLFSRLGTLAAEIVGDFNFAGVPGVPADKDLTARIEAPVLATKRAASRAKVLNGIDVLVKNDFAPIKGKRLGLITNHTGHDRERNPTIDLLKNAPGVNLVALFGPEHGIRGEHDVSKIEDGRDTKTGLPVYSLYLGKRRKPLPEHLEGIDALVFDIQDIGCRFYTYASTMGLAIEAAAENGKEIFILDRLNPINGAAVEGPVLAEPPTFVGFFRVPLRHGMTVGELAKMYNAEKNLGAKLTVIQVENWTRALWFDQTGQPWTNPSPNMRNLKQAALYPGVGLVEFSLSVGRGTDTPFEQVGAPYIDELAFAEKLNAEGLPGVRFAPIRFTPTASIHKGADCGGVYIMLTDLQAYNSVDIGIVLARTLYQMYPEQFPVDKVSRLLLHKPTLEAIKAGKPLAEIRALWKGDRDEFMKRREKFLIYR